MSALYLLLQIKLLCVTNRFTSTLIILQTSSLYFKYNTPLVLPPTVSLLKCMSSNSAFLYVSSKWQHWGENGAELLGAVNGKSIKEEGRKKTGRKWGQCWGEGWKGQNTVFISCKYLLCLPSHQPNWPSQCFETLHKPLDWNALLLAPNPVFINYSAAITDRHLHQSESLHHHRSHHPWRNWAYGKRWGEKTTVIQDRQFNIWSFQALNCICVCTRRWGQSADI